LEKTKLKGKMTREEFSILRILSHIAFVAFFSLVLFLSLRNNVTDYLYISGAAIAFVFYLFSQRSHSLGLASLGWVILGIIFILSFVFSGKADDLTIIISVLVLVASYELTRFGFVLDSVVKRTGALHEESLNRLSVVIRNHSKTLVQVVSLTLISSLVLEYFTLGVIAVNPPALGVTVFVVLAVMLIAVFMLRRE
jgi:hypothetical protein